MTKNNITIRTRKAVAELGKTFGRLSPEERANIPDAVTSAVVELLSSMVENATDQPSPNHSLILRAVYWLPDREAEEIVQALDELEQLR